MKKILIILVLFFAISCQTKSPDESIMNKQVTIQSDIESQNILVPSGSEAKIDSIVQNYADSLNSGLVPADFSNPCFERKVLLKQVPSIFKLYGLKNQILSNVTTKNSLDLIINNKEKYDCKCEESLHFWNYPIDSSFVESNLWSLAVEIKESL